MKKNLKYFNKKKYLYQIIVEYSSVVATIMAGHNSSQTFLDPLPNLFIFFPQNTKNSKPICFSLGLEYVDFCEPYQFVYTKEFINPFFMLCFNTLGDQAFECQKCYDSLRSYFKSRKTIFSKIITQKTCQFSIYYSGGGCQNLMADITAGHNSYLPLR